MRRGSLLPTWGGELERRGSHQDSILRFENDCPVPSDDHNKAREEDDGKHRAEWEPNPAKDYSRIRFELQKDGAHELILWNTRGKKLKNLTINGKKGSRSVELPGIENGLLFYEIRTDGQRVESGKLFIQR